MIKEKVGEEADQAIEEEGDATSKQAYTGSKCRNQDHAKLCRSGGTVQIRRAGNGSVSGSVSAGRRRFTTGLAISGLAI